MQPPSKVKKRLGRVGFLRPIIKEAVECYLDCGNPRCGFAQIRDRIINHLKLTFVADRPPPPHLVYQEVLMAAETGGEYFS
ncbi:MAG: hypothetical protein H6P98_398 [Candidatus Aminicenantes bacterium]|nr:hypothetical protein [Candidatus Aminicenantes bacterium]